MTFYIATVWIEHRHDPDWAARRLVVRDQAVTPIDFRIKLEQNYLPIYEPAMYQITVGVVSESQRQ